MSALSSFIHPSSEVASTLVIMSFPVGQTFASLLPVMEAHHINRAIPYLY